MTTQKMLSFVAVVLVVVGAGALGFEIVSAGSENNPEITDAAGDVATPSLDITKAWLHDETSQSIKFTMQVADLTPAEQVDYYYHLHFTVQAQPRGIQPELGPANQGTLYHASGVLHSDGSTDGRVDVWVSQGDSGYWNPVRETTAQSDFDANRVTVTIPRQAIGSPDSGDRLTGFFAHAFAADSHDVTKARGTPDTTASTNTIYEFGQNTGGEIHPGARSEASASLQLVVAGLFVVILLAMSLVIIFTPRRA
jgi:hypothetical protein